MKKSTALLFVLIIGIYHFFIFCMSARIPLPLDIFTTSSTLIILGISATIMSGLIALTPCLTFVFMSTLQNHQIYREIFNTKDLSELPINERKLKILTQGVKEYIRFFSSTIIISFAILLIASISENILTPSIILGLILIDLLSSSLYYGKKIVNLKILDKFKNNNRFENYIFRISIYGALIFIKLIWLISIIFTMTWFSTIFEIKNEIGLFIILILIFAVNAIFIIPGEKSNAFKETADKYVKKDLIKELFKGVYQPSLLIMIIAFIFVLFHPYLVEKTSSATLKMLKLGGNMQQIYYFNEKEKQNIPNSLINKCDEKSICITKKLTVIIDIGNVFYAKHKDGKIYSLPREKLQPIIFPKNK